MYILHFLEVHKILCNLQFDFHPSHSITHVLISLKESIESISDHNTLGGASFLSLESL